MKYVCPVCGWNKLEFDPNDFSHEICDCCNTEFGLDDMPEDRMVSIRDIDGNGIISEEYDSINSSEFCTREGMWNWLRNYWVDHGMIWSYGNPPENWDPIKQLSRVTRK